MTFPCWVRTRPDTIIRSLRIGHGAHAGQSAHRDHDAARQGRPAAQGVQRSRRPCRGSFSFELELLSEKDPAIDFNAIVGKNVTVKVKHPDGNRFFNGIVSRFSQGAGEPSFASYRAEIVPWLWMLTQTADCRIFQNKTVPDIIQKIFKDLGFTDFKLNLAGRFQPREYCVQYRETDFNFVCRLMEQYGIFYFFEHVDGQAHAGAGQHARRGARLLPERRRFQATERSSRDPTTS